MSERIGRAGQVAWAVVGLAALLALVVLVGWSIRVVWPPLILAAAIVFLLNPIVTALQQRGVPRLAGTALSYLAFFAAVTLIGLVVVPLAADQAEDLAAEAPLVRADVERWINDLSERSQSWIITVPSVGELETKVGAEAGGTGLGDTIDTVRDVGTKVFHALLIMVLAPIIAFYLLVDLPRLLVVAQSLVPDRAGDEAALLATRLNRAVGGFFRGQLMVALLVGVIISLGLALIDLPFWLIVGMVAGLCNVVPLVGPWAGAVLGVLIALTTRDLSTAVWVVAIMAGAQQLDNHFISPMIMQRAVKLHPAAVMLALLVGGTAGGVFGLLIAVPAAAVLKILVGHLWHTYVLDEPLEVVAARTEAADAMSGLGVVRTVAPDEGAEALTRDGTKTRAESRTEPETEAGQPAPASTPSRG
ncbi:MAG: AI-2E family transporter [Actinomycetota bacterium]|nr:AI-2E family transporter [Actinomycetota bacterium]